MSAHDNYKFPTGQPHPPGVASLGAPVTWGAIPETVALAVGANKESKPVWICVQAHEVGARGLTRLRV